MPQYAPGTETRNRLLEAAGEVFGEHGFQHAKVEDICRRAKANVAAVNYHFGGKEQLYLAVLQLAMEEKQPSLPLHAAELALSPEERLAAFIHGFMSNVLESCETTLLGRLMAHEMIEPTNSLDVVLEGVIRPMSDTLETIVADILGVERDTDLVRHCSGSVMGQCVLYHNSRAIVMRLRGMVYDRESVTELGNHITRFSLAALRALGAENRALHGDNGRGSSKGSITGETEQGRAVSFHEEK